MTRQQLLFDLYVAYHNAIKHKKSKWYVKRFEKNLHANLTKLCDDIWHRRYEVSQSMCFIITDPKQREVFAANFRDRIVHHLYYLYTMPMFSRMFIHDTYSCLEGRGTHFGVDRLKHHILSESRNYTRPCYVLKIDIKGYFMHIDRRVLLEESLRIINSKMRDVEPDKLNIIRYLTESIITQDPTKHCYIVGKQSDWNGLPASKSIFHSPAGCGLPIGNLTSQLFSNVYMNIFDQWMKREVRARHYGRYVDDAYVVSTDRQWLQSLIPQIERFLAERLHLSLQHGKTRIMDVRHGVEFLGAYILPYRTYISRQSLRRMYSKMVLGTTRDAVISRIGVLSHYDSYGIRQQMMFG